MIEFLCTCGKRLKAGDDLAGRPVRCPECRATVRVPEAEGPALSGPEALQAAVRDLHKSQAETAPVAEVVGGPGEPDHAAEGLEALGRAAGGNPPQTRGRPNRSPPGRRSARSAAPGRRGRTPDRRPGRTSRPRAAPNRGPAAKRRQAIILGAFAGIGLLLIGVIVAVLATRNDTPPDPPKPEPAAHTPVTETERRGPFTGHQPGELFNHVPFDGERENSDMNDTPPGDT